MLFRSIYLTLIVLMAAWALPVRPANAATPAAATAAAEVPRELLAEIENLFTPPAQKMDSAQTSQLLTTRMQRVMELAQEAERKYPHAANLSLVRRRQLQAASWLAQPNDPDATRKVLDISRRILDSNASVDEKLQADYFVTYDKILSRKTATQPINAEKEIRAFIDRYANTKAEEPAIAYGIMMAMKAGDQQKLVNDLAATMQARHVEDPAIRQFLTHIGKHPDIGKPFEAVVATLDGKTLRLPGEWRGKVVIVDFWASWCGPCRESMPHLKQIYQKHHDKGLEILGVSLDTSRKDMDKYLAQESIRWPQVFSGKGWDDPLARRYGVPDVGIPFAFLVGKDGKIITAGRLDDLDPMIESALQAPHSMEAGK